MKQYELVLHSTRSNVRRIPINGRGLILGRSADADVIIDEGNVSRRHARVRFIEGALHLEYLGSRSGIQLNGERVRSAQLQEGDRFTVGECVLIVAERNAAGAKEAPAAENRGVKPTQEGEAPSNNPDEQVAFARVSKVYRMASSLDDFLHKVLVTVMNSVQAQRGFVFSQSREEGLEPKMLAFYASYNGNNPDGPILNRYTVEKVFEHANARYDGRRKTPRSNGEGQLEDGTMCVPLLGKRECVGALYVDSPKKNPKFTKAEFEQLIIFGRVIGVAVEKAQS